MMQSTKISLHVLRVSTVYLVCVKSVIFTDKPFLAFFFKRLKVNTTSKYSEDFPFISPCGRELNYIRCYDRPVVFQHVVDWHGNTIEYEEIATFSDEQGSQNVTEQLSYGGVGCGLVTNFQPHLLHMSPVNGHVYHPASDKVGGYGLVASKLAFWLSKNFIYEHDDDTSPTHFMWKAIKHKLDNTWTTNIEWKVHLD